MNLTKGITVLLLFVSTYACAQDKFNWAVACQGMSLEYKRVLSFADGNSIALANKNAVSYRTNDALFKNSQNKTFHNRNLIGNSNSNMIICFDSTGAPTWVKTIYQDEGEIVGMMRLSEHEVVCVVLAYRSDVRDNWHNIQSPVETKTKTSGTVIKTKTSAITYTHKQLKPGLNIVTLSTDGYIIQSTPIQHLSDVDDMDIDGCVLHQDGLVIVHGFVQGNSVASNLEPTTYSGGGDFILAVGLDGIPKWQDIVHYRVSSCCSRTTEGSSVSVAPDGKVYFGGTYFNGGIFSNKLQTLTPWNYGPNQDRLTEVFVVNYTQKGKIRWVKTAQAESRLHSLSANAKGVTIGFYSRNHQFFGESNSSPDETYTTHIVKLNTKGKTDWMTSTQFQRIHQIQRLASGNQVCVGSYKLGFGQDKKLGRATIPSKHDLVVFELGNKSKVSNYWSSSLLLSKEKISICSIDQDEHKYLVAFETWCGLSLDLKKIDKSLPDVKCYGGTPIVGEIELND